MEKEMSELSNKELKVILLEAAKISSSLSKGQFNTRNIYIDKDTAINLLGITEEEFNEQFNEEEEINEQFN